MVSVRENRGKEEGKDFKDICLIQGNMSARDNHEEKGRDTGRES